MNHLTLGRARRRLALGALAALAALAGTSLVDATAAPTAAPLLSQPPGATTFRVSSFNLLGAGHTAPNGNRHGWASGRVRMGYAAQIIADHGLDVIGFQEMQPPQLKRFQELDGKAFGIYPGSQLTEAAMANSIAWRLSDWTLVSASSVPIPYFGGNPIRMPYVLLKNTHTGQLAYFYNAHHPANARGNAEKWRNKATQIEIALFNRLRAEAPGVPLFVTGDMNEREDYFCPITGGTELLAANGGWNSNGTCRPPGVTRVDWVLGTSDVTFTSYLALRDALVAKTTDHFVIMADASIQPPPLQDLPVRRVLVLDVEGLRPGAIRRTGTEGTPTLHRLIAEGASTLNARSVTEHTTALPNLVSMLTGRRVNSAKGGHGVNADRDLGQVVRPGGLYVSSVFDLVHNHGGDTALFSSNPAVEVVHRTWGATGGGVDPYGVDNGRNKIDQYVLAPTDEAVTTSLTDAIAQSPRTFTFVDLTALRTVGRTSGFMRTPYLDQVKRTDAMIGRILAAVEASDASDPDAGATLVLLTSGSGGTRRDQSDPSLPTNYMVPFIAWGGGVAPGTDLYALNPAYANPADKQVAYSAVPPVRNSFVANITTAFLGLPAVPGSTLDSDQSLNLVVTE